MVQEIEKKPDNTDITETIQKIDKRKTMPHLFKKGQSGNPKGKPKGSISIKARILQRLKKNPDELKEIVEYFIKHNRELMWQMLEGRPKQQVDLEAQIEEKQIRELVLTTRKILELNVSEPKNIGAGQKQIQKP